MSRDVYTISLLSDQAFLEYQILPPNIKQHCESYWNESQKKIFHFRLARATCRSANVLLPQRAVGWWSMCDHGGRGGHGGMQAIVTQVKGEGTGTHNGGGGS